MAQLLSLQVKQNVLVTTVTSDGLFFVQLGNLSASELPELSERIAQVVTSNPGKGRGFYPSPGTRCFAKRNDTTWLRALVLKINTQTSFTLYYVDYGNTESNVPLSRMFPPIAKFFELSFQAIQCQLANFIPNEGIWSETISAALSDNILNQKIPALFHGEVPNYSSILTDHEVPCYLTTLYWEDSDDQYTVADEMVAMEMGSYPEQTPNELLSVPKPKPSSIANESFSLGEYTYLTLDVGQEYNVYVSSAESPDVIWCQRVDHSQSFETMVTKLQHHMITVGSRLLVDDPLSDSPLAAGQPCCVRYVVDMKWCRGEINDVDLSLGTASVLFVDYGNVEEISITEILKLPIEFYDLPVQGISFSLYGVAPAVDEGWSQKAIDRFHELYTDQELKCHVVGLDQDDYPSARLTDATLGTDIGLVLVQEGFAVNLDNADTEDVKMVSSVKTKKSFAVPLLQIGKVIDAKISFIESFDKFYCQSLDQSDQLDRLMELVGQHCVSADAQQIVCTTANQPVLAMYSEDQLWYRGTMVLPQEPTNQWQVYFVDYGNTEPVNLHNVRVIPEAFLRLPAQAFRCSLVNPPKGSSPDILDAFIESFLEQEVQCKLTKQSKEGIYSVKLSQDGSDIIDLLLNGATPPASQATPPKSDSQSGRPQVVEQPRPLKSIPPLFVPVQEIVPVVICYIETLTMFACQLLDNYEVLTSLFDQMNEHYNNPATSGSPIIPAMGMYCAGMFSQDGNWYRAKVASIMGMDQVGVVFVDYGNSDIIPLSNTRELATEFFSQPIQGIICSLDGYPGPADAEITRLFEETCLDSTLKASFVTPVGGADTPTPCKLFDFSTDREIAQFLKSSSAVKKQIPQKATAGSQVKTLESYSSGTETRGSSKSQTTSHKESAGHSRSSSGSSTRSQFSSKSDKLSNEGTSKTIPPFRPDVASPLTGLVSHIVSPLEFYVQPLKMSQKFEKLTSDLSAYYGQEDLKMSSSPQVNSYCVAQSYQEDKFYRCLIIKKIPPSSYEIFCVDIGRRCSVEDSQIFDIIDKFTSLPVQAICCSLRGFGDFSIINDVTVEMKRTILNQEVEVSFIESTHKEKYIVDVILRQKLSQILKAKKPSTSELAASNTISYVTLPAGKEEECLITAVSPSSCQIYCQLISMETQLNELENSILETLLEGKAIIQEGQYVLGQFTEDDSWYRARISRVNSDGNIEVLYIDYGNQEVLPVSRVKQIHPALMRYPAQAIPCQLVGTDNHQFTQEAKESLEKFLLFPCIVRVVETTSNGIHVVHLKVTDEEEHVDDLTQWALNRKILVPIATETAPDEKVESIPSAVNKPLKRKVMKFKEHAIGSGEVLYVYVSNIDEDDKTFWIQRAAVSMELDALTEQLDELYSDVFPELVIQDPQVGQTCCAKYSEDNHWCRAQVIKNKSDEGIEVLFVDYGNQEMVDDVYQLVDMFYTLPLLAVTCQMDNEGGAIPSLEEEEPIPLHFVKKQDGVWMVRSSRPSLAEIQLPSSPYPRPLSPVTDVTVSMLQIKPGDIYEVLIANTESAAMFWCQLTKYSEQLEELMALISDYYTDNVNEVKLEEGAYCVAKYSVNNTWYRAKITQVISPEEVKVYFIDYGNSEVLSPDNIQGLLDNFAHLPSQALSCSLLPSVHPQSFTEDQLETFFSLNVDEEFYRITVNVLIDTDVWYVTLQDQHGGCVNDYFLSPVPSPEIVDVKTAPTYRVPEYSLGIPLTVFVTCVNTPDNFYCQPLEMSGQLEELMNNISSYMKSNSEAAGSLPVSSLMVGQACLACFNTNSEWYRGQVEEINSSNDQALIRYVDYGNLALLGPNQIAPLPSEFFKIPTQALSCSVVEGIDNKLLSREMNDIFHRTLREEETYTIHIVSTNVADKKYAVDVYEENQKVDFSFLYQITPNGSPTNTFSDSTSKFNEDSSPSTQEFTNSCLVLKSSKSPTTDLDESEEDSTNTGEPLIHAPCNLSLGKEPVTVKVVHVKDPLLVYLQREDCTAEMKSLSSEIAQYCTDVAGQLYQQVYQPGDFVLAQGSDTTNWLRAKVIESVAEDLFKVHFIDYGNEEEVSPVCMVMCPGNFLELPIQAIPCSLAQVPSRDSWPHEYIDYIYQLTNEKILKAHVMVPGSYGMPPTIQLVDVTSGMEISEKIQELLDEECEEGAAAVKALLDIKEETSSGAVDIDKDEVNEESGANSEGIVAPVYQETSTPSNSDVELFESAVSSSANTIAENGVDNVDSSDSLLQSVTEELDNLSIKDNERQQCKENGAKESIERDEFITTTDEQDDSCFIVERDDSITITDEQDSIDQQDNITTTEEQDDSCFIVERDDSISTLNEQDSIDQKHIITTVDDSCSADEKFYDSLQSDTTLSSLDDSTINQPTVTDDPLKQETKDQDDTTSDVHVPSNTEENQSESNNSSSNADMLPKQCGFARTLVTGSKHLISIVNITSPSDFVCHLMTYSQVLEAMNSFIFDIYKEKNEAYALDAPPNKGDLLCALKDDGCHRVKFIRQLDDKSCEIEYLDYGGVEVVSVDSLFQLDDQLSTDVYSPFIVKCSLYGVEFDSSVANEEVIHFIKETFKAEEGPPSIEIVDSFGEDTIMYNVKLFTSKSSLINDMVMEKFDIKAKPDDHLHKDTQDLNIIQ